MTNRCYLHWICWRVVCPAVWGRRLKRTTCTSSAAVCKHSDRSSVNSSSLNELSKKNLHWLRKRNTATQLISGISFKRIIKQSKKIVYRNPLKDSEEGAVCSSNVSLVSYPCERYKFVIPTMNASNTCILVNYILGHFGFGSVFRWDFRWVLNSDWDRRSAKKWSRFLFGLSHSLSV